MSSKSLDISLPPQITHSVDKDSRDGAEGFSTRKRIDESQRQNYEQIGLQLLQDDLLLSALELYIELSEFGHEIQCLKQFFSNPGNFEKSSGKRSHTESTRLLVRSSSQVTLDSLDFAPLSEDGDRSGTDDRIAVLEFELRKARETICALRANLTKAAEQDNSSNSETNSNDSQNVAALQTSLQNDALKPFDRRALNFLVHEYLLTNSYRLTSITFADENPDQDLENWDDVGLNIERPPDLLSLYKRRTHPASGTVTLDAATQTTEDIYCSPKSDTRTEVVDVDFEADGETEADITIQVATTPNDTTPSSSNTTKAFKDEFQHGVEDVYQKLNQLFSSGNRSQGSSASSDSKNLNPVSQLAGIFRKKL